MLPWFHALAQPFTTGMPIRPENGANADILANHFLDNATGGIWNLYEHRPARPPPRLRSNVEFTEA